MKLRTVLFSAAVVFGLGMNALAGMPATGTYSYHVSDPSLAVWDVSGTFSDDGFGTLIGGDYSLAMDSSGKLTGGGSVDLSDSGVAMAMNYTISGTVKTTKSITAVQMNMKLSAKGSVSGYAYTVGGSFKYNMVIDQASQTMYGTVGGSMKVSVKGLGSESFKIEDLNDGEPMEFSADLSGYGMDGSWDVSVLLGTDAKGKPIVQNATVTLSNGREMDLAGKMSFNAKKDLTTLTLKGSKDFGSNGATLKLIGLGSDFDVTACTGKLLGQALK